MLILIFLSLFAQAEEIKLNAFLDTYYAYDLNRPKADRLYTTQAVKNNQANINLASIGAHLEKEKIRGQLTLQYGNSVDANYGTESGKMFQEAFAGVKLKDNMWLDGGIYLGHIGMESWISKDNFTYTRSMMNDYTPYYSSGIRLSTRHSERTSSQIHVMNGWQNIEENNQDKAIGIQVNHLFTEKFRFSYNNFAGNEKRTPSELSKLRLYHDFIFYFFLSQQWKLNFSFDLGSQKRSMQNGEDYWYATSLILRNQFREDKAYAIRLEYFCDPHQANVMTASSHGFKTLGASFNYDQTFDKILLWRTEVKSLTSEDKIYPGKSALLRTDNLIVTSMALSF